jgi:hypothetical protein
MGQPRFSVVACALHIATTAPHKTSFDHEIVPGNSVFMLILRSFANGVTRRTLVTEHFVVRQRTIRQIMTPR